MSLTLPLPAGDTLAQLRDAEAALRRDSRERAGLAQLGPGGVELAGLMDRTASFLLTKLRAGLRAAPGSGSRARLAAPLRDFPGPGDLTLGTYVMTSALFNDLLSRLPSEHDSTGPSSKTVDLTPTRDEVTIDGNKGTITTTITASAGFNGSKVSVLIRTKVSGEVLDKTGTAIYSVDSEYTGVATGDVCPDASGVARAQFSFHGREDYTLRGVKLGQGVIEGFSADMRFRADDNAKLAGVELSPAGAGIIEMQLLKIAASSAAPEFEKGWRSGLCLTLLVDPESREVEKDSVTKITVKVKHKIDGTELDKPVEAKLFTGDVKSIKPEGEKRKAPATFEYTAGSNDGDRGAVNFESVSNRGIGNAHAEYTVGGGTWTISSTGTLVATLPSSAGTGTRNLKVAITALKLKAGPLGTISGSGKISVKGPVSSGGVVACSGQVDASYEISASGTLVGTGPGAVLRVTIDTSDPGQHDVVMTCSIGGVTTTEPYGDDAGGLYGDTLGEFDLPAAGGRKTVTRSDGGGIGTIDAGGTFTVVRGGN